MSHSTICACVVLQSLLKDNNTVASTRTVKDAVISTVKEDDEKVIFIRISPTNNKKPTIQPIGYPIIEMQVFERFSNEGKATIKLPKSSIQIMISNCPPGDLQLFLMTLKFKFNSIATNIKDLAKNNALNKLLPRSISVMDVISPIRKSDAYKVQQNHLKNHFNEIKPITPEKKKKFDSDSDDFSTPPQKKIKLQQFTSTPNGKASLLDIDNSFITPPMKGKLQKSKTELNHSLNDSFQLTENFRLTAEQIGIMERIRSGQNIFYTGSAGTGKTHLIKRIIGILPPQFTAVTASTGVAASLIDGCTLHAFAGIGVVIKPINVSVEFIMRKPQLLLQWRKCKHLIIDEVSLVTAEYFDHLDKIARIIRNISTRPFGGIQLILCGDFFQLPPVMPRGSEKSKYKYVFQSRVWKDAFKEVCILTEVKRQSDYQFIKLLSAIRVGRCPEWADKILMNTENQVIEKDGIIPTKLCTHKVDVEEKNNSNLEALAGEAMVYIAQDSIPGKESYINQVCQAESKLTLKIGAQVMLIKNIDVQSGLANGSRGIVVKFEANRNPIVKFACGQVCPIKREMFSVLINIGGNNTNVIRQQLPLKLAYAISVHKSQGMTLDCVELHLYNTFECGQAYVALSRCKSLNSMRVFNWNKRCVMADKDVIDFYKENQSNEDYN